MRLVFLGTPASAVPTLEEILREGHEVVLAITQPDRPAGRHGAPRPTPVKLAALRLGVPVIQPVKVRDEPFRNALAGVGAEALVVVAYGRILPEHVLDLAPRGAINVHFSLLPKYRGAAPVQWALINRESVTGVTTMRMSQGLDEGDILLQREIAIDPGEHAPALLERLSRVGATLLAETLRRLETGDLEPRPQEEDDATFAPRLTQAAGGADFRGTAREIEGRVRGLDPWPGVWARHEGRRVRLVRADTWSGTAPVPDREGEVLAFQDDTLVVACGWGSLLGLRSLQFENRNVITAREAVSGRQLVPGDRLESDVAQAV